jgi:hypothetical protein
MHSNIAGAALATSVAIVDATDAVGEELTTALEAAGFASEQIRLTDFATGGEALASLVARGVDVIVYDAGERFRADPIRFADFYNALRAQGLPLLITTTARWLAEEQATQHERAIALKDSASLQHLILAIRREL